MAYIVLLVLTVVAVAATAIPFCRHEGWWVRGFDFPRLQFAALGGLLLAADILLLDFSRPGAWAMIGAAALCLCVQLWWIIPYTKLFPVEVHESASDEPGRSIRIMTANVLQSNKKADTFLRIVEDARPDVLVALEANAWWQGRLEILETSMDYRFTIKCPLENLYGMVVYSKFPLENAEIQFLVEEGVPSMHALVTLPSGMKVRIHFLHPAPPSPSENEESSERDAELLVVGKSVAKSDAPVIVTGDLNDVAWSATTRLFRKASGLLDPRIGRGMFNSYNAKFWFLRWPLDHLFCSRHFHLRWIRRMPAFGSDHFPMLMELVCEPRRGEQQEGLEPDQDDREQIEEKIEDEAAEPQDVPEPEK